MRRKSERVKDKSAEKKAEKSPKKTKTRSTRRRKKSSSTSPESSEPEDVDPSFEVRVSKAGVSPDMSDVNVERGSGRTRRTSKRQSAAEEVELQVKAAEEGQPADAPLDQVVAKEEASDPKHKEKEGKSSMWQVKSADDSSGSEIKKLKLCIVRPTEPELSPRKRKKLSRSSHRETDEDLDESFARDSSGERRRNRRSLRNASDDASSPEKLSTRHSVKPKSGESSEDGQRTQDSLDEIASVTVDEPDISGVSQGNMPTVLQDSSEVQKTFDPLDISSNVQARLRGQTQRSPVEGKFADSSDSESQVETCQSVDPFDALKSAEVVAVSVDRDISGVDVAAAVEKTVFVSCDSTVELAKPGVVEEKPESVSSIHSSVVCDSSIEIQHCDDVQSKVSSKSEKSSCKNVLQKLPEARDSSKERSVSRGSSAERVKVTSPLKEKPVMRDTSEERKNITEPLKGMPEGSDSPEEKKNIEPKTRLVQDSPKKKNTETFLKETSVNKDSSEESRNVVKVSKRTPIVWGSSEEKEQAEGLLKEVPSVKEAAEEKKKITTLLKEKSVEENSSDAKTNATKTSKKTQIVWNAAETEKPAELLKETPLVKDSPVKITKATKSPEGTQDVKVLPEEGENVRKTSKKNPVVWDSSENKEKATKLSKEKLDEKDSPEKRRDTKALEARPVVREPSEERVIDRKSSKEKRAKNSSEERSVVKHDDKHKISNLSERNKSSVKTTEEHSNAKDSSDNRKKASVSPEKSTSRDSREERRRSRRRHESPDHKHRHLNRSPKKLLDVAEEASKKQENQEKPREKIALKRSKSSHENATEGIPSPEISSAPRKRRWGSTAKKPVLSISSDSLKNLIPEAKPLDISEVELTEEEKEEGEVERDEEVDAVEKKPREVKLVFPTTIDKRPEEFRGTQRTISLVGLDTRSPSPPRHRPTAVLFINNLTRPFTVNQLKELLARTGTIVPNGFWTNVIRSKCYVEYSTESEARETRRALHGVRWPVSNPKQLNVDFARHEDMEMARELAEPTVVPRKAEPLPVETRALKVAPVTSVREWDLGKSELGAMEENRMRARASRERERRVRKERSHRSVSPRDVPARKMKKEEDAPAKLLDDLFRKTKLTPCIYWLPLTAEQIVVKEEIRRKHMAEHRRRMDEIEKEEKERRERMQGRRINDRRRGGRRRTISLSPKK